MTVEIRIGDCRDLLRVMPDQSVNCCVTSPPYFGLRDYGTATWQGGDSACEHEGSMARTAPPGTEKQASNHGANQVRSGNCHKCGARRIDSQIGLEPTPDAFVAEMVAVFAEVRRVLRDDGTLWLNLGDSYAGGGNYRGINSEESLSDKQKSNRGARGVSQLLGAKNTPGCKPKDLIGVPWMVAFALRADGWYLRQDIIWAKPNPMPESVTDRCTKAHEYIFLLSKSARYWYDVEAVAEPAIHAGRVVEYDGTQKNSAATADPRMRTRIDSTTLVKDTRNRRSVWTVATQPFKEAHFATFPPELIEPCIKAGCPAGGTVLDPFGGAGTTGLVADRLKRNAILLELNPAYADMARRRIAQDAGIFANVV